ncbi:Mor transcription activator family protein [Mucispirillum schaedleri]
MVRQIRNNKIIEEFKNGVSLSQLRKKYNLSETALRKIIYKN